MLICPSLVGYAPMGTIVGCALPTCSKHNFAGAEGPPGVGLRSRDGVEQGPDWGDSVEKVEKSSATKTPQIAIRLNIAAQHHLRRVQDLVRCAIDKLAGPPADFLNAAPVGLPENRTLPKGSFSTQSALSGSPPLKSAASGFAPLSDIAVGLRERLRWTQSGDIQ